MKPNTSQRKEPRTFVADEPGGRRNLIRAAAFFAVAMLAALAVHGVYQFHLLDGDGDGALHGSASESAEGLDPDQVVQHYQATVDQARREAGADVDAIVGQARAEVDTVAEKATVEVSYVQDKALATVQGAAGQTGGLPAVPAGYVPGMPVDVEVGAVADYAAGGFGDLGIGELEALEAVWAAGGSGVTAPASQLPGEVGEAQGEVGDATGELADDPLMAPLWVIAGMTGVPVEDLVRDGTDGSDVEGALSPDEDGAIASMEHADRLLARGDEVVEMLQDALATVEAQQTAVVGLVEDKANETRSLEAEYEAKIRGDVQAQVEALLAALPEEQARLQAAVDGYAGHVEGVRDDVLAQADAKLGEHAGTIGSVGAEQKTALQAEAEDVLVRGQALVARVQGEADRAVAQLEGLRDHGIEVDAQIEAVQQIAAEGVEDITVRAETDAQALLQEADGLKAYAEGEVARLKAEVEGLRGSVEGIVADAVARAEASAAFGQAEALATTEALVASHVTAAEQAIEDLHAEADAHVQAILTKAMDLNQVSYEVLAETEATALAVKDAAGTFVQEDLDYILAVAEDYAQRGPADVEDKAEAWLGVHDTLSQVQGDVSLAGDTTALDALVLQDLLDDVQNDLLALGFL